MSQTEKKTQLQHVPANKLYWMATDDDSITTVVPAVDTKEYEAWVKDRDE